VARRTICVSRLSSRKAIAARLWSSATKASEGRTASSVSSPAITLAERGLPSIPESSPKQSPVPMVAKATSRPDGEALTTLTVPRTTKKTSRLSLP
jgi:hypothetical protein